MAKVKVEFDTGETTSISCALGRCIRKSEERANLDWMDEEILKGCKRALKTLGKAMLQEN